MHRIRTSSCTARLSFRLSIERALAALYKRRAEIENLIACLDSQGSWTTSGHSMNTRPQLQRRRKKSRDFRQLSSNSFQTHVKTPPLM